MAAPPCCPPGSIGRASEYVGAKGSMTKWTLNGREVEVYISGEPAAKVAVLGIVDVFSIHEGRAKGAMDFFASKGFFTALPDFHFSDPVVDFSKFGEWLKKHDINEVVAMVQDAVAQLKAKGAQKIFTVGFCWGVWVQFSAAKAGVKVDGQIGCHPSIRLEEMYFQRSPMELGKKLNSPVLIMAAGNDPDNVKPGGDLQKIVGAMPGLEKSKFLDFAEMDHGWTIRGDVSDPKVKRDVDAALGAAVEFISSI
eukprot:RCo043594